MIRKVIVPLALAASVFGGLALTSGSAFAATASANITFAGVYPNSDACEVAGIAGVQAGRWAHWECTDAYGQPSEMWVW